ncbi:guanylate kinase [Gorillibacterium sp. CAU 1737]|uniref:guanylate kinase n=1 Tax=Gorillibacterium sp. CAU 1737 TaxID=3140362 RepID=UPI003261A5ED
MTIQILVMQGPSASGKTTLQARLGLPRVVTWTSRAPRQQETHGIHYYFASREEMERMREEGAFLETTVYNGHLYGTPLAFFEKLLREGERRSVILDPNGARRLKQLYPEAVLRIGIHAEETDCRRRLLERGTAEEAERRLQTYADELAALSECDMIIANSDEQRVSAEAIMDLLQKGLTT